MNKRSHGGMRISTTEEYALRALACLVVSGSEEGLRSKDLSERTGVPLAYLSKVLRQLVDAKILKARRGHGGGFVLRRPPHEVTFASIFAAVQPRSKQQVCVYGWRACSSEEPCPLHDTWKKFRDISVHWALTTTLADITVERGRGAKKKKQ